MCKKMKKKVRRKMRKNVKKNSKTTAVGFEPTRDKRGARVVEKKEHPPPAYLVGGDWRFF